MLSAHADTDTANAAVTDGLIARGKSALVIDPKTAAEYQVNMGYNVNRFTWKIGDEQLGRIRGRAITEDSRTMPAMEPRPNSRTKPAPCSH